MPALSTFLSLSVCLCVRLSVCLVEFNMILCKYKCIISGKRK